MFDHTHTHTLTHTHSIALQHNGICVRVCFVSGIICIEFSVVRSSIWAGDVIVGGKEFLCCSSRVSMVAGNKKVSYNLYILYIFLLFFLSLSVR